MPLSDHLRLLRTRFSPLETQLLAAVRDVLPARTHATFDAQVAAVNKVQRELFSLIHHHGDPVQITGPDGLLELWGRAKV